MSVNTWDPGSLLPNLRGYLAGLGVVRDPKVQGDSNGNPPPLWLDPKLGTPYPGQTEGVGQYGMNPTLVMAAYPTSGVPSRPFEGFYQQRAVTLYYRGKTSPAIQAQHNLIHQYLHDVRDFSMNGLQVNQSMLIRELQRISSDEEGYVYNCELLFDLFDPTRP